MTKRLPCSCAQGYHKSLKEKTACRLKRGLIHSSEAVRPFEIHGERCRCGVCEKIRVEKLILFFKPEVNRMRVILESESSEGQSQKCVFLPQSACMSTEINEKNEIWATAKIQKLMNEGVGVINSKVLTAVKNRKLRVQRNHTFLRMYLFLNPQTILIVQKQDWVEFVRPHQLILNEAKPVDCRTYRQRIQQALEKEAKKYKLLCTRTPQFCLRTPQMMDLENRINYLSEIVQKFNFIEDYDEIIAQKEYQRWEQSIVVLKKGERCHHMIESFSDLSAIGPYFHSPDRKKINLNIIESKQKLERKYVQILEEAKYYGLIQKASTERREKELLLELEESYSCQRIQKMEIEPSTHHKSAQRLSMDIEYSNKKSVKSSTKTNLTVHYTNLYVRSYLSPRVVIEGIPMTNLQMSTAITSIMKNFPSTPSKMPTESTHIEELFVFSEQKSIAESQSFLIEVAISTLKPILSEFKPKSDLKLYSLNNMQDFPKIKKGIKFYCLDFQQCSRIDCQEWLSGSILQCPVCRAQYHHECWANVCRICEITRIDLPFKFNLNIKDINRFEQMKKTLTPPPQSLTEDEAFIAISQIEKNLQRQAYCVTNCYHENFKIVPFHNYQLKRLHPHDQAIIDQYENRTLAFPVTVREINAKKGKGLVARRPIAKGQIVSTYSGNVVSLAEVSKLNEESIKPYLFHLISGPEVTSNFVVYPSQWASAGYFMNHCVKGKANVKTFIALHRNGPIVIMQAAKKIDYAHELLYDYNGEHCAYDTGGFQ